MPQPRHFPGFDGLRLAAAALVMYSHAYLIATGVEDGEPLVRLLGPGHVIGLYCVFTFFIISGFLLSRSLEANPSAATYVINRGLRIFPGFAFCVVVTAFVIGPLLSRVGTREYLTSAALFESVGTSLQTLQETELPGLFDYPDSSGLASVVNGSLWSLRYEVLSYVLLLLVWVAAPARWALGVVLGITALLTWVFPTASVYTSVAFTLPYFAAGVGMHWFHSRFGTSGVGALVAASLLVAAAQAGWQDYAFAPLGAYLVIFFGERPNPGSWAARRIGDCSYGLYLFGWPAEQIVKQLTLTTSPLTMFALALPLALACALVSYHLVEAPAMRLRRRAAASTDHVVARLLDLAGRARHVATRAARGSFVLAAALMLTIGHWWFVLDGIVQILLWTMAGSAAAVVAHRATTALRIHRVAAGR